MIVGDAQVLHDDAGRPVRITGRLSIAELEVLVVLVPHRGAVWGWCAGGQGLVWRADACRRPGAPLEGVAEEGLADEVRALCEVPGGRGPWELVIAVDVDEDLVHLQLKRTDAREQWEIGTERDGWRLRRQVRSGPFLPWSVALEVSVGTLEHALALVDGDLEAAPAAPPAALRPVTAPNVDATMERLFKTILSEGGR